MGFDTGLLIEIAGSLLLFCLVFGMSATVDVRRLLVQLNNKKAIATGLFLQFVILPALGFAVVKALNLSHAMGITLLVVTSSPGGSYSNWWCSLFNADLALSVTMTAISTILSVIMLPVNLFLYASLVYHENISEILDWTAIFASLAIVILAIALGLVASQRYGSHKFHRNANLLGNLAGIALVVFSAVMSNTDKDDQMWERPWKFYVGVASPCVVGLILANILTLVLQIHKPERVTVSIECCYQNVGIATSVALTMFEGDELSEAMGVPFFYGLVEAVILAGYCLVAWKAGWTKAPADAPICTTLVTSYEIIEAEEDEKKEEPTKSTTELTEKTPPPPPQEEDEDLEGFHYVQHSEAQLDTPEPSRP